MATLLRFVNDVHECLVDASDDDAIPVIVRCLNGGGSWPQARTAYIDALSFDSGKMHGIETEVNQVWLDLCRCETLVGRCQVWA